MAENSLAKDFIPSNQKEEVDQADGITAWKVEAFLTFRRTWSYRWIAGPVGLSVAAMAFVGNLHVSGLAPLAVRFGLFVCGMSMALGMWLPGRLAVWPLRIIGGVVALAVLTVNLQELLHSRQGNPLSSGFSALEIFHHLKGVLLVGVPGLWFAATGKVGWRESHRPVII